MKDVSQLDINELISNLASYNNRYREIVNYPDAGKEVLEQMWLAGDLILNFTTIHQIKPHNLYWKIYGKSQGVKNSYITRDFLSYCLRIRNYFDSIAKINENFPRLKKYSTFREALPLLDNPKQNLAPLEKEELLNLINSSYDLASIKKKIVTIKHNKIGKKNPRTQRLIEMKHYIEHFVQFYDLIHHLVTTGSSIEVKEFRRMIGNSIKIEVLASSVMSLCQEGLTSRSFDIDNENQIMYKFVNDLHTLHSESVEFRNRYRRVIPSNKLFNLSEMINALKDDKTLSNFRIK